MSFAFLADVGLNALFKDPIASLIYLMGILLIVCIAEAGVIWAFKLGSLGKSFLGSLVMNSASTLVGIVLTILGPLVYLMFLLEPSKNTGALLVIISFWAFSVAIEASILIGLKWKPIKQVWVAVAVANAVTYGVPTIYWLAQYLSRE